MFKKLFYLTLGVSLLILFILNVTINIKNKKPEDLPLNTPLKLVNEVTDQYDNILQQIFYDEKNDRYLLKEYTYILQKNKWVCTNQQTVVISKVEKQCNFNNQDQLNNYLKIYYNSDLSDGPITIMDNEYVKVSIVKYLAKDNWWEFGYELKVVNKTNSVITFMIDNPSIMDIQCKPLFTIDHVDAKNTAYFTMAWDKETLERCYIPYIDNIEFMIRVYDNENWKTPALAGNRLLIKQ